MPTKLSRYAEGIMEAAWLAAIIVVPVFFNIYSSRIFEPDKLTLLRTLALVILAAWAVKLVEEGRSQWKLLGNGESPVKAFLRIPLLAPVLALVVVYLIATIFSITPRASLLGSYQRLQGTYTTFSYVVVFAAVVGNMRKKAQVERLVGTAILASLPVSLYGVLQRFQLDPIPWGGDVTSRVAANLGNSIFVAAYLILAIPLTLMRIVESFEALLTDRGQLLPNFVRATGYVFIVALQVITLYFSGSRGPWLGWFASLVFIWLGLSLIWRQRWLTVTGVTLALIAGTFLILLNVPNGPFEGLRAAPAFYRISRLLDAESRTGQVRTLIWEGASELVQPHEPLEYPDGSKDSLNFLRPLIGYGPEGMYVAYNPFYPPELTQVEKRNASPDRSHNETWDSLVITGVLGLIVYLTLFGSVLYYGLKWLGLVRSDRQRYLYLGLYLGGGLVSSIAFVMWQGVSYLGVALPFGMVMGVMAYLILSSLFGGFQAPPTLAEKLRAYILLGLLATIVAHFVEINFGIAIAATRTYFWTFSGLLLVVGYILPRVGEIQITQSAVQAVMENAGEAEAREDGLQQTVEADHEGASRRSDGGRKPTDAARKTNMSQQSRKRKPAARTSGRSAPGLAAGWLREALLVALLVSIVLVTLGYNYITNSQGGTSSVQLVWSSLTKLRSADAGSSFGVLALLLTSWLVGCLVLVSESVRDMDGDRKALAGIWGKMLLTALGVSMLVGVIFWTLHAGVLLSLSRGTTSTMQEVLGQVQRSESILSNYYVYLLIVIFGLGAFLPIEWPQRSLQFGFASYATPVIAFVMAFGLASYSNLRVIQADIAFKTADLFARNKSWAAAIEIYQRANELAPNEDYYYLFLGRAYLEYARSLEDVSQREQLISKAAEDLRQAQAINPLNTDHTANLARLYSLWATYSSDAQVREGHARESENYFSRAVVLSPNNARLWDEWATLYLNVLKEPEKARERLEHALTIDPYYDWTYGLLGDYYSRYGTASSDAAAGDQLIQAADYYSRAVSFTRSTDKQTMYGYVVALAGVYVKMEDIDKAIEMYQKALEYVPNQSEIWKIEDTLARLLAQKGDLANALLHAQSALEAAPEDQKERVRSLISQLGGQP